MPQKAPTGIKKAIGDARVKYGTLHEKPSAIGVRISGHSFEVWLPGTDFRVKGEGVNLGAMNPGSGTHSMVPRTDMPGAFSWKLGTSPE